MFYLGLPNSSVDCKYLLYFLLVSNQLYWHFLYCFGFNLKKNLVEKVNIYNQQLNFWRNNWRLHNWRCRKPWLYLSSFLRAMLFKFGWKTHLGRMKLKLGVFEISTGPTKKTLTVIRPPMRLVRLLKPLRSMETTVAQLKFAM